MARIVCSLCVVLGLASPALADDTGKTRALALFADSNKAYKAGDFERAAELLRDAYRSYPEPILLYNLARALEGMGDPKGAVDAYERYLAAAAKIEDRGAIERRVATLKDQLAKQAERPPEPVVAPRPPEPIVAVIPPPPPPPRRASVAPWIAIGIGAAVTGSGAVFGYRARDLHDQAAANPIQLDAKAQNDRAQTFATAATIQLIAGGALITGGVVWKLLDRRRQRTELALDVGPSSIGIAGAW